MKITITAMLCASIISHAFAQDLPGVAPFMVEKYSRYYFEFENGNKLIVYAPNVGALQKFQNIDSTLALFLRDYKIVKPSLEENVNGQTATYKMLKNGQYQLDLTEHKPTKQRFQFRSGESEPLILKTVQDTLLMIQNFDATLRPEIIYHSASEFKNEQIYFLFIFNNLDTIDKFIKNGTANTHIKKALEDVGKHKSNEKLKFFYYNGSFGDPFWATQRERIIVVAFHQTFGLGVYQNQIMPNSQTEIAFVPTKNHSVGYTLSWRSMFFTERNDQTGRLQTRSNGFLSAGFTFYDSKYPNSLQVDTGHVLFGIYLGRQLTRSNAAFENGTWNLAMTVAARGIVKIQPEIYFNGFFKNVMPGLRVQMGF